ncbi:MAG: tRNA (N(6)-L-threonylcarbamoyladenosine(37)-C(2))-methylthiotransferase MtaB [Bacteroidales bacterium]|jgi:threonylcarbamoyladenosine tRNA methylthiotransferase MtaB
MFKISYQTFGCKLNFAETISIINSLDDKKFSITSDISNSDIHIIHTCTVTSQAEKKCRQAIRHAVKENKNINIIVLGCYSQLRADDLKEFKNVKYICGNESKFNLKEVIENIVSKNKQSDDNQNKIFVKGINTFHYHPAISDESRTRTFLKIQDGCDYYCTYCAIPYARGHNRSGTIDDVLKEAKQIVKEGIKEIVLTGVNIGEFGTQHNQTLYELLLQLIEIEGLERIRISSIEPNLINNNIIKLAAESQKIMPHFHIPLQAGTNKILKLMKRKYTVEFFADKVLQIKDFMPDSCIAVDLITGFPGEDKSDFKDTINFIKSIPISYLHVFSYSDRPEALSSKFKNKNSRSEIKNRSKILHKLSTEMYKSFVQNFLNTKRDVLFEYKDNNNYWWGWSDNYIRVKYQSNEDLKNTILKTEISEIIEIF